MAIADTDILTPHLAVALDDYAELNRRMVRIGEILSKITGREALLTAGPAIKEAADIARESGITMLRISTIFDILGDELARDSDRG